MSLGRPQLLLFGDSLTQQAWGTHGWASRLAEAYQRRGDVINRGFSGYNSRWALASWSACFHHVHARPHLFTLWLGANDAVLVDGSRPRQHVPLVEYEQNLKHMVAMAKDWKQTPGCTHVILLTPPPVSERMRKAHLLADGMDQSVMDKDDRTNQNTGEYARCCVEVGKQLRVPTIDLWTAFQQDDGWEKHLTDGLHLSASGQEKVYQMLMETIQAHFSQVMPEALPFHLPKHDEIDVDDVDASFAAHVGEGR
mmetsp:Transcript_6450/g.40308  ORF Transcript_6450/g.40308 Transcript_6450/m.40308 type:complete len:253 (+) Transcript_6450:3265-4023(+)